MDTAKIFQNGQSQAVRLPKQYRFEGDRVIIKRWGRGVVLLPYDASAWDLLEQSLGEFTPDFMDERAQPSEQQTRESL